MVELKRKKYTKIIIIVFAIIICMKISNIIKKYSIIVNDI